MKDLKESEGSKEFETRSCRSARWEPEGLEESKVLEESENWDESKELKELKESKDSKDLGKLLGW